MKDDSDLSHDLWVRDGHDNPRVVKDVSDLSHDLWVREGQNNPGDVRDANATSLN